MEQVYKVLINKVDSEDPEEVRFGKYCYLFNDRIYISANQLPEKVLPQLEKPIPEIQAEEILVEGGNLDNWQIVHDSTGTRVKHWISEPNIITEKPAKRGRPSRAEKKRIEKESLESEVKALAKRKLSQRMIATKLGINRAKVQRILA